LGEKLISPSSALKEKESLLLTYPWGTALEKKAWEERSRFPILFLANSPPDEENHAGLIALIE